MTRRVVKGDAMEFQFDESNISIEHIRPGLNLPKWLFDYQLKLAKWNNFKDENNRRIMIIYANEESRKQALRELNKIGKIPLDSSLHLTIPRLIDLFHSDLRLPKLINKDGILFEIIHLNCARTASKNGFPLLHPNNKIEWSRGKTKTLNQLHERICEEDLPNPWEDDPGIIEFENILQKVEKQMSGTHPNLRIKKIIDIFKKNTEVELFSLRDVDGIIIQDLSPTLSPAKLKLLQLVSNYKPIHQLCNSGSFRLGEHGAYLADVEVCKTIKSIPEWVPKHELESNHEKSKIYHLGLFNSSQLGEAIHNILYEYLNGNQSAKNLMLVDTRTKEKRGNWNRLFESLGIKLNSDANNESAFAGLSWLEELMKLGQGPDAWACSKLKMVLDQNKYLFTDNYISSEVHVTYDDYLPIADYDLLEETARTFHILGGSNSLNDWLYALSAEKFDNPFIEQETQRKRREQTQWWLLSIANFLYPLLSESDRDVLNKKDYYVGCNSNSVLPRFRFVDTGDKWLSMVIKKLNWDKWMDSKDSNSSIIAIQRLISLHSNLRDLQLSAGFNPPLSGEKWIEETSELLNSITISDINISDSAVRILTPENALGCNAEIVIFIGLSNDDWDLSTPPFPWLDSGKLKEAGLLNLDEKIRAARHNFNHILSSGKEIFLIDPTMDSKTYPSTPFAEWYSRTDDIENNLPDWFINEKKSWILQKNKNKEIFTFIPEKIVLTGTSFHTSYTGSTLRSVKQSDGILRRKYRIKVPLLNPEAPFLIYENELLKDRIKREPLGYDIKEDYLDWSERLNFVSNFNLKLIPPKKLPSRILPPRNFINWPVIGKKINSFHSTVSIDPRPLEVQPSGIEILDKRSGHSDFIKFRKEMLWSTSKLNKWIQCPRRGWLESELHLSKDNLIDEDLDFRTRGITLHESFAELICMKLNLSMGKQRQNLSPKNLCQLGTPIENLMSDFIKILSPKTPWIWRNDAMAVHRRKDFIGMSLLEFEKWWEDECPPITPIGRLGQMLISEFSINDSVNIAFEWKIDENKPVSIELPDENNTTRISLRGWIDRVDLVPFENGEFCDESGDKSVAPIFVNSWKPRRLILIRDIKSVEGPSKDRVGEKHLKGIFEDIQLALYARAWEIANPGDQVIGVGISEVGDFTKHYLEIDPEYKLILDSKNLGIITNLTKDMYRIPNEGVPANSNSFRAWLFWKIKIALKASKFVDEGFVHPTPGEFCNHCSVKSICR